MIQHPEILVLTKYGRLGASSRMRSWQYLPWLERHGLGSTVQCLLPDRQLQERYGRGGYGVGALVRAYAGRMRALGSRHGFAAVWIEKEALPWMPAWLERSLLRGVPYVLDYDDAIFHNYDRHRSAAVRRIFGRRLDRLMADAALVVGGNSYLAERARNAGAAWVEVLPTPVDLDRYPRPSFEAAQHAQDGVPRIVWVGSPSTARYLQLLREPLQALARRQRFKLRVIGGGPVELPGVDVELRSWSEATEVAAISECDVGIMPLEDSPWERGKCGYKLIQYMACGLPVVASDVGANAEFVRAGTNGSLARSGHDWVRALAVLLSDPQLRALYGQAGREAVEQRYCLQRTGPQLAQWLRRVALPTGSVRGGAA